MGYDFTRFSKNKDAQTVMVDGEEIVLIAGGDGTGEPNKEDGTGEPNKGDGSNGGGKQFSQDDVNRFMADNKKALQAQNVNNQKQIEGLTTQLSELKGLIGKFAPKADNNEDDNEDNKNLSELEQLERRLSYERKQSDKRVVALENKLKVSDEKVVATEAKRLTAEKDRFLDEALVKANCLDLKMAKRMFRQQMEHDSETGDWFFTSSEGVRMTPEEGVLADLPDYLRRAQAKGGSGGKSPRAVLESGITKQKDEVKSLQERAGNSGNDHDLTRLLQSQRKLKSLEAELSAK